MNLRMPASQLTRHKTGIVVLLIVSMHLSCGRSDPLPPENPDRLSIQLRSPAFADGAAIPKAFTCDGSDRSPPLEWSGIPDSTRSLALICDDPDAPGRTWSHWIVYNIPAAVRALREGVPIDETIKAAAMEQASPPGTDVETRQGKNDFGNLGYSGPCPPHGTHRYYFRLYALDDKLELTRSATRADVLKAIKGRILAEGRLMGTYQRDSGK
jgi:Raf kinase inhibitor-like YbhB/YbcL family protein